ncbi:hypothetical protein F5Y04DRAFT_293265 [Hypomontagnella monticulosa]|nr:hypothetical protein F5Y04DRAFT_293265 [Hypomontagnella monticulosa]
MTKSYHLSNSFLQNESSIENKNQSDSATGNPKDGHIPFAYTNRRLPSKLPSDLTGGNTAISVPASLDGTSCYTDVRIHPGTGSKNLDAQDPYREPIRIPRTTPVIYLYPHGTAVITRAHHDRSKVVIDMFAANCERDREARKYITSTNYELRLCGSSASTACPSIVVYCFPEAYKPLRKVLECKRLKMQYSKPTAMDESAPPGPFFKIYYWRDRNPFIPLRGGTVEVPVLLEPIASAWGGVCGKPVYDKSGGDRVATLGCAIQVGSVYYGLTVSHSLRKHKECTPLETLEMGTGEVRNTAEREIDIKAPQESEGYTESIDLAETDDDSQASNGDITYEDLTDDEERDRSALSVWHAWNKWVSGGTKVESQPNWFKTKAKYPNIDDVGGDLDDPDLDWALVELEGQTYQKLNVIQNSIKMTHETNQTLSLFGRLLNGIPWRLGRGGEDAVRDSAIGPRPIPPRVVKFTDRERDVLIAVSPLETKCGLLQQSKIFLGGIDGRKSSWVWSVILKGTERLSYGDSGSVVVDAETFGIYGHVIGMNPLGEIYISPFADTLFQISRFFPRDKVSLPDPLVLLAASSSNNIEKGFYFQAGQALQNLHLLTTYSMEKPPHFVISLELREELIKLYNSYKVLRKVIKWHGRHDVSLLEDIMDEFRRGWLFRECIPLFQSAGSGSEELFTNHSYHRSCGTHKGGVLGTKDPEGI